MVEATLVCKTKFYPTDMLAVACKSSPAFPHDATRKHINAKCDSTRHVDKSVWLWQVGATRTPETHTQNPYPNKEQCAAKTRKELRAMNQIEGQE
jgi:hypothetical protein